jgi:hypothetical protein
MAFDDTSNAICPASINNPRKRKGTSWHIMSRTNVVAAGGGVVALDDGSNVAE